MTLVRQTLGLHSFTHCNWTKPQHFKQMYFYSSSNGEYYYHLEGTSFDAISYDSRKSLQGKKYPFCWENSFKKEYLELWLFLVLTRLYVSEKDYEVGISPFSSMISSSQELICYEFVKFWAVQFKLLPLLGTKAKDNSYLFLLTIFWNKVTDQLCHDHGYYTDGKTSLNRPLTTPESWSFTRMFIVAMIGPTLLWKLPVKLDQETGLRSDLYRWCFF